MKRVVVLSLVCLVVVATGCKKVVQPIPAAPPVGGGVAAPPAEPVDVPPAPVPVQTVAELPDYPGATVVASEAKMDASEGFTRKASVQLTTADPLASVVAFYQTAITDFGWTVTATQSKAGETEWKLSKGTSVAEVDIEQKVGRPVEIKLSRKDR